ncbi:hypothetical protein C0995_011586 [Termitomyces sp. Mi166|nr:hypothetical protein C0995_011586 [Termitomyces sp. Mi166\
MSTASTSAAVQGNGTPLSNEPPSLRSKVIEILAGTANGCLTELGYYPGMPQRLQELERQNAQWQMENVKLFQDNQVLTHALQERKGLQQQQEKTIHALQVQIQGLLQEKSMLMKDNQNLLAGHPAAYRKLLAEYKQFQEHYQRALQENKTLRLNNAVLSRTPVQSPVTPGPLVFNPPIFGPQGAPSPQMQKPPSSAGPFPVVQQNLAVNPKQPTISLTSQEPRQLVMGDQNYARKSTLTMPNIEQAHLLASHMNMHNLHSDEDLNLPRSISRISRSQPSSRPTSSTSSSRLTPISLSVNTTPAALAHIKQKDSVTYLSPPMSAPPIPQQHPFRSPPVVEVPSSQQARPLLLNSILPLRKYSLPTHLSHPMEPSVFVPMPSALQTSQPDTPMKRPIDSTATPKDAMNDTHSSADVNSNEEQKPLPRLINAPANHIPKSASPVTPFKAVTPMNATVDDPPPVAIVSISPIESLKRSSLTPEEFPTPKKPRLEEQENVDSSVESIADTVELPTAEEDPGESEDEEIRVGPDGLRLVEDCLPDLIEDDEENAEMKTCKLCAARFRLGFTAEPKPFINATTEELVQHCLSEHQSAWERLRTTV